MDLRPPLHAEGSGRLHASVETLGYALPTDDPATIRHQADRGGALHAAVSRAGGSHREGRRGDQLRRRGARRGADSALGDAEGALPVSRETALDLVAHGGGYPRGLPPTQGRLGLPTTLRGGSGARHRRLAPGHECHTTLQPALRWPRTRALHRTGADAHAGTDRPSAARDRGFPARAILGAEDRLSRCHLHGLPWTVCEEGGGRGATARHRGATVHRDRCHEKEGP